MTQCVKVAAAFAAFCALHATADDLPARLEREFARLGSEDPRERDRAVDAIVKEGVAAAAAVKARIQCEEDPEVRARLEKALDRIEVDALLSARWEPLWKSEPFEDSPTACVISPDGKRVATGGADGRIRVLDAATREVLREFETQDRCRREGLAFSPDGSVLLHYDPDAAPFARAWRLADGREIGGFARKPDMEGLEIWAEPGGLSLTVTSPGCFERGSIVFASDGRRFSLPRPRTGIFPSADGSRIAIALPGDAGLVFNIRTASEEDRKDTEAIRLAPEARKYMLFEPDGELATAAVLRGGSCGVHELSSGKELHRFGEDLAGVRAIPGGWLTWTEEGRIQWWKDGAETRSVTGRPLPRGNAHVASGLLVLSSDSPDATSDFAKAVIVRSLATGELVEWHPRAHLDGPWAGGAFVIRTSGLATRLFFDGKFQREIPQCPERPANWVSVTQSGPTCVVFDDPDFVMFRFDDEKLPSPLPGHKGSVLGLRWQPDGLTAFGDGGDAVFAADGTVAERVTPGTLGTYGPSKDPALYGGLPRGPRWATPDGRVSASLEGRSIRVTRNGADALEFALSEEDAAAVDSGVAGDAQLAISNDGKRVAMFGPSRQRIEVWSTESGKRLASEPLEDRDTRAILFASDGRRIAVVDDDNEGLNPRRRVRMLDEKARPAETCEWAGKGILGDFVAARRWVVGSEDGVLRVADLLKPGREQRFSFPEGEGVKFTVVLADPGLDLLVVRIEYATDLYRIDMSDGSQLRLGEAPLNGGGAVVFADGNAAVMAWDGLVFLRRGTWDPLGTRKDLAGSFIAGSPDGRKIAISRTSRILLFESP